MSRSIRVTVYDRDRGESISFTLYPLVATVEDVARVLRGASVVSWKATRLDSRRHKRR